MLLRANMLSQMKDRTNPFFLLLCWMLLVPSKPKQKTSFFDKVQPFCRRGWWNNHHHLHHHHRWWIDPDFYKQTSLCCFGSCHIPNTSIAAVTFPASNWVFHIPHYFLHVWNEMKEFFCVVCMLYHPILSPQLTSFSAVTVRRCLIKVREPSDKTTKIRNS